LALSLKLRVKTNEPVHNGNLSTTNICPGTNDSVVDGFCCIILGGKIFKRTYVFNYQSVFQNLINSDFFTVRNREVRKIEISIKLVIVRH
jgi:hypothetical protein